jgi:two-component system NtrC family sensor kinase
MTTLLYVDDEEAIGRGVARYFGRRGDTVLLATTVADACAILGREDPSAVVIDVWLGKESGFDLLSWIQESRPHLAERVIFVTGELVGAHLPDRSFKTLGRPVLEKPFAMDRLADLVDAAGNRPGT